MQKWRQQLSIGYFVIALVLLFALQTFFASPSRRNNYLQPVQDASEEGTSVQCRHRRKNNSRRNQSRRAKGSFTRRAFEGFK
jgi:hypothetical protein